VFVITSQIQESIEVKYKLLHDKKLIELISMVAQKCTNSYRNGCKILLAGNGGSAADAQHIAGEFVSRFNFDRPGIPSIALSSNTSILTAIANDYSFDLIFSKQIEALGIEGDIFFGISTSGNSKNIVEALNVAKRKKIITVGFTGQSGGEMEELCDYCIKVPSTETPRIQESHIMIGHIICSIVENDLFGDLKPV
jgi:D-sedoheptulose 7-phosphate isomerase